ncbi:hypothetical protein Hanom_Chr02g00120801 [Helianthus anomalus]
MFTPNCKRCPFAQKFIGGVLILPKSCTFCPLGQIWLEISINSCHVQCTRGYNNLFLSTPSIFSLYDKNKKKRDDPPYLLPLSSLSYTQFSAQCKQSNFVVFFLYLSLTSS